ncbi:unnamed protein product [Allacma fusca]|uniref:Uncharacterized protein n=1 Tax=Allacma fusca TaxID=39272 RepID=A0A8J2LN95_9HEXA|nr:unnamed protein product [Allacma fusca]
MRIDANGSSTKTTSPKVKNVLTQSGFSEGFTGHVGIAEFETIQGFCWEIIHSDQGLFLPLEALLNEHHNPLNYEGTEASNV